MRFRRAALLAVLVAVAAILAGCPKKRKKGPPPPPPVVELLKEAALKSSARKDAVTLLVLPAHAHVAVPKVSDKWAAVVTSDGHAGFVPREAIARRAVLFSTGPFPRYYLELIADRLRTIPTIDLVGVEVSDRTMPGSPAGGVSGARQLAAGYKAPLVIAVTGGGRQIQYEADDLEHDEMLVNEYTHDTVRLSVAVDEVRDGVARVVMQMPSAEGPALFQLPAPGASPAVSSTPSLPHPNAAFTPAPLSSPAASPSPPHPNAAFTPAPAASPSPSPSPTPTPRASPSPSPSPRASPSLR
jgi:hypothetical protein